MRDPSSRRHGTTSRLIFLALIAVIFVGAAILRFAGINWDQHQHVHPDERFIVWVADTLSWPGDLATALDPARSTINPFRWPPGNGDLAGKPRNYAYGHFPLYLLALVAHVAQAAGSWFGRTTLTFPSVFQPLNTVGRHLAEYQYLPLVGRALSAIADLGTLLLVYALGRRIGEQANGGMTTKDEGRRSKDAPPTTSPASRTTHHGMRNPKGTLRGTEYATGLLAAAIYAFAVLPIQLSHFVAVDAILTFCVTATLALAARWTRRGGWGTWLLAGAMAGLAVGSKFSAVLLVLPLAVAALYRLPAASLGRKALIVAGRLAAAGAVALAVFVLTNPFAVIEFPAYVRQITAQNAMVSGLMDAPYTRQYIGTLPYLYFVQQLSQWGLGWPLGVVAWGGFIWAVVEPARQRANPAIVVMLAWVLPYFAFTGAFHTKFPRYMAPLLPFLAVFGAGAAMAAYRWLAARWGRRGRLAWGTLAVGVAVVTLGWALAFTGVYRQEHPWIAASRWIYANIPEGKKLLTEHWDDSLPLTLDELPGKPPIRSYQRTELPMWDPDTREKLDTLVDELSTADYIVLASNRASAPMARLGGRYPMASQYYRMLFAGDLGYRPVAEFTAYPRLGGLVIRDDSADESFSVYDHPHVLVFENQGRLKPELLRARLGRYLPAEVQGVAPHPGRPAGLARYRPQVPAPGAPLTLSQPVDTLPVVADFRWNRAASESPLLAVVLWWLALSLFGWLAWPLLFPLLGGLRDRGYGLARVAGWLLIGWLHWLGVSLGWWQNRVGPIVVITGLLAAAGLIAGWAQRRRLAAFWAERRRTLLAEEGLFALAYLAFVGVRLLNPDLWQPWNGGEKFMEFAFLNATLRSPNFPPYDPYFAGGILNYYYYGFYLVGLVIKLTGIAAEVAFNLAVPGLFALTALGLFSVGSSLATVHGRGGAEERRSPLRLGPAAPVAGGLAVLLALLMGNLRGLGWLAGAWVSLVSGRALPEFDYWAASRVIPNTINEFPLWTFVFADLHPHMIAMPFGLLVVGLALNWVAVRGQGSGDRSQESGVRSQGSEGGERVEQRAVFKVLICLSTCLLIALALGSLGAINTWDLPTYALLVAGAFVVAGWRARRWLGAAGGALLAVAVMLPAVAAYWPFYVHYEAQVGQDAGTLVGRFLGWVRAGSPLDDWLVIWGFFLLLAVCYVAVVWRRGSEGPEERRSRGAEEQEEEVVITVSGEHSPSGAVILNSSKGDCEAVPAQDGILRQAQDASVFGLAGAEEARNEDAWEGAELGEPRLTATWEEQRPSNLHIVSRSPTPSYNRNRLIAVLVLLGGLALLAGAGRPTAAIAALPLCLALPLAFRRKASAGEATVALLLALGLSVIAGTELIYLRDFLSGGDWYRMNTLFKFSVPAWLFLALAGGVMLPVVWAAAGRAPAWIGAPIRAALGVMLAGGLVFLVIGVPARVDDRFPGARPPLGTLDATAYMTVGRYTWPGGEHIIQLAPEREAIRWLLDNVTGTPVIAEAPAGSYEIDGLPVGYDYYRAGGLRVASLTGLPTFVGQHQYEQRPGDQVGRRFDRGKEFFTTTDLARTRELMETLRVGYVYVGQLERLLFSAAALRKFDVMADAGDLEIVYRNPEVTLYRAKH